MTAEEDGSYNIAAGAEVSVQSALKGDVNKDGVISAADAAATLQAVAKLTTLDAIQSLAANVDGATAVAAGDAAKILRVVAKLDPAF